uniref:Protein kinase domain-containing protein n=1 Tax=Neolamprologus brichardi TaxID=32507 RepID=A0A3Q4GZC6_NEOBR
PCHSFTSPHYFPSTKTLLKSFARVLQHKPKNFETFLTNSPTEQTHFTMSANSSLSSDDLEISKGTILGDYYEVEGFLGEGGFGIVTKSCNTKPNKLVAIKVNKSDHEILQQAKMEIFILEQLQGLDADRCNIVEWNGFFLDHQRICLDFELLETSIKGLPISELRPVLHQLTNALSHLGSLGIVHADLKPRNIMVVDRDECPIKVKLVHVLDHCLDDLEELVLEDSEEPENSQHLFVSLIKQMLALDPNQRITPSEVLHHPFFNPGLHWHE